MLDEKSFLNPDKTYSALQIIHDFDFLHWNTKDYFGDMSSMNDVEKQEHIRKRLEDLAQKGFGGVVLNVAFENYLEDQKAWALLGKAVDIAFALGLRVWIYDEQYYPSGCAGGIALKNHPEYEAIVLTCVTYDAGNETNPAPLRVHSPYGHSSLKFAYAVKYDENGELDFSNQMDIFPYRTASGGLCWDVPPGKWRVFCFFTRTQFEGSYLIDALRAPRRAIDYCNKDAVKRFLDVTYSGYIHTLGDNMHKIEGIFFDEPGMLGHCKYPAPERKDKPPMLPSKISFYETYDDRIPLYPCIHWSTDMEESFKKDKGYSLAEKLPAMFEGGKAYRHLRIDYCDFISNQFRENFVNQYKNYLKKYSIKVGGHYRLTKDMGVHPRIIGDVLKNLGAMDHPGCDRLSAKFDSHWELDEKLTSSAAHLYGNKKCLVEGSDMYLVYKDLKLPQLLCSVAMDFAQGINIITSYYDETVLSVEEYNIFNLYISRLGSLLNEGIHCAQALLYHPFKQLSDDVAIMNKKGEISGEGNSSIVRSYSTDNLKELALSVRAKMIDFDYINDECLLKTQIRNGKLYAPSGEAHSMLLLPDVEFVPAAIAEVIQKALSEGIYVGVYGKKHEIEGLENIGGIEFFDETTLPESKDLVIEDACNSLRYIHKKFEDYDLYLVVQTEDKEVHLLCNIPFIHGKLSVLDLVEGTKNDLELSVLDGRMHFNINLKPYEAKVYMVHR